jgi:DNA polymerase eta
MTLIEDAKKLCPDLVVQHVATYREGESEAGYWDDVDRRTHKVGYPHEPLANLQVSLDPYRRESLKILAVFREMAPTAELGGYCGN